MAVLQTERLLLRHYVESDLGDYHRLVSDKGNMYYLDDIVTDTFEQSGESLHYAIANADGKYFCMRLKRTDEFVGSVGYTISDRADRADVGKTVHMGYFILPEFQGRGLTTEAVIAVIDYAFDVDDVELITTGCYSDNIGSRKVMEKAGFKFIEERKKAKLHDGVLKGRLKYAISKHDYFAAETHKAQTGDIAALERLIKKYTPMVNGIVSNYFVPGAEREDLLQEGLIGLYGAVLAFDPIKATRFRYFAKICIERRLNTVVKAAFRGKHAPLRAYEPIPKHYADDRGTPEDIVLGREELVVLEKQINARLSGFERETLALRLTGLGNVEIAEKLGTERKVVENAIWRARMKIKKNTY